MIGGYPGGVKPKLGNGLQEVFSETFVTSSLLEDDVVELGIVDFVVFRGTRQPQKAIFVVTYFFIFFLLVERHLEKLFFFHSKVIFQGQFSSDAEEVKGGLPSEVVGMAAGCSL